MAKYICLLIYSHIQYVCVVQCGCQLFFSVSLSPHLTRSALARRSELKPEMLLTSVIQADILNSVKTSSQGTNDDSHSVAQTHSSPKLPPAELKNIVRNFRRIKRSQRGRKRREELRLSPQSDSIFILPEFHNSTGNYTNIQSSNRFHILNCIIDCT